MKALILLLLLTPIACASTPQIPPSSKPTYSPRVTHIPRPEAERELSEYYNYWRKKYLKATDPKVHGAGYYIEMKGVGPNSESSITTSEAHGYGMLVFVLLSDFAADSKTIFDGFVNVYINFRSTNNPYTMSWMIQKNNKKRFGSATDGDLDIAYALLLADKKWGSTGNINYIKLATNLIQKGIKTSDFSKSHRTNLGDWDKDLWNTRSSDWMPSHFQAFYEATGDRFWLKAIDTVYDVAKDIQSQYSPRTGLLPDFIVAKNPKPAPPNYLNENTVDYSWNACRTPLRIVTDYGLNSRPEAHALLIKSLEWIMNETKGNPNKLKAGYYLDGRPQVSYTSTAFIAPWVAAASIDPRYQSFVNKGWDYILKSKVDYFSDSIGLLSLIYLSERWEKP